MNISLGFKGLFAHILLLVWFWVFDGDGMGVIKGPISWRVGVFWVGVVLILSRADLLVFYGCAKRFNYFGGEIMGKKEFYAKTVFYYVIILGLIMVLVMASIHEFSWFVKGYLSAMLITIWLFFFDYAFPSYARYQRLISEKTY